MAKKVQSMDEPTHVRSHHLARVAVGRSLALSDGQVMIGAVHAIDGQRGDVAVGGAHVDPASHLHHDARRILL